MPYSQLLHDFRTVHMDFKTVLDVIRANYPLYGDEKTRVISQLEKSLQMLQSGIQKLETQNITTP